MLSTADIDGMRATLDGSLPDTCTVLSYTRTSDGAGGQTYPPVGSPPSYACRIAPRLATGTGQLKDAETIEGQRLIAQAPWMITLPALVTVTAEQRIRSADGREFEVFAVLSRRSWELATRVLCRLINDGAG